MANPWSAMTKRDGKMLWHALDLPMGYATPLLVNLGGERQVIVCSRPFIVGLRLDDGVERWRYRQWHINNNERPITQPLMLETNVECSPLRRLHDWLRRRGN